MSILDFSSFDDSKSFDLMPEGDYSVIVDSAEESESKSGNRMLKMKLKVTEGDFKGRLLFENMLLSGNENAIKITVNKVGSLLKLNKKPLSLDDFSSLVGLEAVAKVKVQKSEEYGDKNVVSFYKQKKQSGSGIPF